MCGRFTNQLTWREIVALYRLAVPATPERNLPARYNICPTDVIDVVIERANGKNNRTNCNQEFFHGAAPSFDLAQGAIPQANRPWVYFGNTFTASTGISICRCAGPDRQMLL